MDEADFAGGGLGWKTTDLQDLWKVQKAIKMTKDEDDYEYAAGKYM